MPISLNTALARFNLGKAAETQQTSTPTPTVKTADPVVALGTPKPVDAAEATNSARAAAQKLIDVVTSHKDLDGDKALAGWGMGDARITERRGALATLLSEKTGAVVDLNAVRSISREIAKDIEFLKGTDRKDYTVDGKAQFDWHKPFNNHTVSHDLLQREFETRVKAQTKQVEDLASGKRSFLDVSSLSMVGVALIKDGGQRSGAMMDALLQFRARTDTASQREDATTTRIDRFGAALLAEQRATLASTKLTAGEPQSERDYALLREVISSHPISSTNQIYEARNAVSNILTDQGAFRDRMSSERSPTAWIWKGVAPGATASAYSSIHHNFSRDTPKNIDATVAAWFFPKGDVAARGPVFSGLTDIMASARAGKLDGLADRYTALTKFAGEHGVTDLPKLDLKNGAASADALRDYLKAASPKDLGKNVEQNLEMAGRLYRAVCSEQPGVQMLESQLFRAGSAFSAVADVMVAMTKKDDVSTLRELGEARLALKDAVFNSASGFERHELIKFDANVARMANEHLGAAVDRLSTLDTDGKKAECLVAVQSALRSAVASGLDAIVGDTDAKASGGQLKNALADVDAALSKGSVKSSEYRQLMGGVLKAVAVTVQNIRHFADTRAAQVATSGAQLDPEFIDQFVKQSPLHYATALAEKGARVGLTETIGAKKIENVEGMRVLNGIGPVVFKSVVFAENSKQLAEMGTNKDQLAVLYKLEEKKMVAVGGLFVDTAHAPGGNSHLNMYAMNNGIPVVALPDLRGKYGEFFKDAGKEGGIYVDDSGDGFTMMTVAEAQKEGRISTSAAELDKLRPGVNRRITFLKPTSAGDSFEVAAKHDAIINEKRATRDVEIYIPQEEVRGIGRGVPSFKELSTLGIHARHLAGEKGTVLALLSQHAPLAKHIPDGSQITPGDVADMLDAAKLKDGRTLSAAWDAVWLNDPKVGVVDDRNFMKSAFYTDAGYRKATRETLVTQTREALEANLLDKSGAQPKLSAAGQALYANIMKNAALSEAQTGSIIFRSSFTAEDRPGKSGAGQYESYVDRKVANQLMGKEATTKAFDALAAAQATKDPKKIAAAFEAHNAFMGPARVASAIGVVESAWMPEPIENNVAEQFFLKHVGPTCVVQACMTPDISGVMISRDVENGARNQVTFQLVKGFGGGVDGGKATEGVITKDRTNVAIVDGVAGNHGKVGVQGTIVDEKDMQKLREIVLETERFFMDTVEPGKGHAVDMEVARQDGEWKIVQARVILMDK
ncbi:MAG TPA: PEP/pyruvate-binding domain-containing protein [Myxococcota bacterium]